jgi:hypothetical protein
MSAMELKPQVVSVERTMMSAELTRARATLTESEAQTTARDWRATVARSAVWACAISVLVLIGLQLAAVRNLYGLRVIGDTPTFMTLIRELAVHPLHAASPFFGTANTHSIHASPYLQLLGLIWRWVAPSGHVADPIAIGRFVALATIPLSLFVLAMVWLFTRALAGRTAAFIAVPVLLAVFGPVHLAFPSDLSINGLTYAGYYPTTVATGLTLTSLLVLRRSSIRFSIATVGVLALTVTTDPLNGAVASALVIVYACRKASASTREGLRVALVLSAAFVLARAWPAFDTWSAYAHAGLPVPALLALAFALPVAWPRIHHRLPNAVRAARRLIAAPVTASQELWLADAGLIATLLLVVWSSYAMGHWPSNHLLSANRLGFYWNDQRDRWLLLLLPAAAGLVGLRRLAQRGEGELPLWFLGAYAIGLLGAAAGAFGISIPLYYRFVLLCQVPIAIGVAYFLADHRHRIAAQLTAWAFAAVLIFNVVTLVGASKQLTYFGSPLPAAWRLGSTIPDHSGIVASDPSTSYYVPVATGNHVLTLGQGHADSGAESQLAQSGYRMLRGVYAGSPTSAASSLRAMWAQGVRWVVVEKFTVLDAPTLREFTATPYSGLAHPRDVPLLAAYNSRLASVGEIASDSGEFTVYRLDPNKLQSATSAVPSIAAADRPRIAALLERMRWWHASLTAAVLARELRQLGVRSVTFSDGWLGSVPMLSAYGANLGEQPVTVPIPFLARAATASAIDRIGSAQLEDAQFGIVSL